MKKPNGIILWSGYSLFNNDKIVAIAVGTKNKSANAKTGHIIQTFILPQKHNPFTAWVKKCDKSICGNCLHREWHTCYVNKAQAPLGVWKAYKRGNYPKLNNDSISLLAGKIIRIGSYGDPAAVPIGVWEKVAKVAKSVRGYTHAWRNCNPKLKNWCMASVETDEGQKFAQRKNWRTFRTRLENEALGKNEIVCPASKEANHKTTCEKCGLCSGNTSKSKKNVAIVFHGWAPLVARFARMKTKIRNHRKYRS